MKRASRRSKALGARQRMIPPPYSAIVDRPPLAWPGGARVAVWPMLAIEHFVWGKPKITSHTWLTTSDAIYDRMAERSPAP